MNKNILVLLIILIIIVGGVIYLQYQAKPIDKSAGLSEIERACVGSGGTIALMDCYCSEVKDFPNLCEIGACTCNPMLGIKYEIKTCDCGQDKCFNGEKCTTRTEELQR